VTGCDTASVHSGMRVEVAFAAWSEEVTVPVFKPFSSEAGRRPEHG
jgi:hypothetical protein